MSNELGSGAFGRVYRATAVHDIRAVYAVKIQEKRRIIMKDSIQQVKREASLQVFEVTPIQIYKLNNVV